MIKAMLLHLGSNMWEQKGKQVPTDPEAGIYSEKLRFDYHVWEKLTQALVDNGFNTLLIDLAEGVKYNSHPELAVEGSWSVSQLKDELARLRKMGLNPIPKLNFSCAHSAWLQNYAYMVGTPKYYEVCRDLIEEVIDIFDTPDFFHLGLEEEDYESQKSQPVAIVRAPYKKCEDAKFLFDTVRKKGVRPWMWADVNTVKSYGGKDAFINAVGKDVLLSNWEYGRPNRVPASFAHYIDLGEWGYEQVPTSSICGWHYNNFDTMEYCKANVKEGSVVGYMEAPWSRTVERRYFTIMNNIVNFRYAFDDIYGEGGK